MKSYEQERFLAGNPREQLPEGEAALYEILVPQNRAKAIKLEGFKGHYSEESVQADIAYVQKMEAIFNAEDKATATSRKFGELFEAVVNSQIQESDWMGGDADVIVPSRFDDIKHGIDSVVEFTQEKGATSHLALGIDVTKAQSEVKRKMEKIRESIRNSELSSVKYFESTNFRGQLRHVPRVIVGADHSMMEDISATLLKFIRMKQAIEENRKEKNESELAKQLPAQFAKLRSQLADHPLQRALLIEIKVQLEAFKRFAEKIDKAPEAAEYERLLSIVDGIIAEKEEDGPNILDKEKEPDDEVFRMILAEAAAFDS